MLRIELNPQLTKAEHAAIARYLTQHGRLSAQEWLMALRAFDLLGDSTVTVGEQGVEFVAHNIRDPVERRSRSDLIVLRREGDIKTSPYFLVTARTQVLRHDFYITRLYDVQQRRYRIAVIMTEAAWRDVNGDTMSAATLEEAASLFPQAIRVNYAEGPLVIVDYHVWKQRVKTRQREE